MRTMEQDVQKYSPTVVRDHHLCVLVHGYAHSFLLLLYTNVLAIYLEGP